MTNASYRRLRGVLKKIGPLRSTYYLFLAVGEILRDSPADARRESERVFERQRDPYGFDSTQLQRERLDHALKLLDAVTGGERFKRGLEIGCAEGAFTELLSSRCDSLLALDFSRTAIERARKRLRDTEQVRFQEWDLRQDSLAGAFDLIVIMSVLDCFANPRDIHLAREKLANLLAPHGHLLVSNIVAAPLYDEVWWTKWLIRGAERINQFIARHPALREVATEKTSSYVHSVFQKRQ